MATAAPRPRWITTRNFYFKLPGVIDLCMWGMAHALGEVYDIGDFGCGPSDDSNLEGEVRLNTSGTARASCSYGICSSLTLSSGTEDYFLGTY